MEPEQRGLGDRCVAVRRWQGWTGSRTAQPRRLAVELSAVLNPDRGLSGADRVAGLGAVGGIRARGLPLIPHLGEL